MLDKKNRPEKAYKNMEFLNSHDGRLVRILSEFLEPQARFRRYQVRDTIVFFGSARILPPEVAVERLREAEDAADVDAKRDAERAVLLSRYYADAVELADRLTRWSMSLQHSWARFVVCSGGGPGIMEAANRGAKQAGGRSVALNISLPMEQMPNPYDTPELSFEFHYFFVRKYWFLYLAKALIAFPGGFGTLDELFEVLTLLQTGKTAKKMPVVVFGGDYWRKLINFGTLVEHGMIHADDMKLLRICDTVDEAFAFLTSELTRLYVNRPEMHPNQFPNL